MCCRPCLPKTKAVHPTASSLFDKCCASHHCTMTTYRIETVYQIICVLYQSGRRYKVSCNFTSLHKNIMNVCVTFWDMFDEGGGPSGHPTDKCSRPARQTLIWQPEEVRHAVTDAPHQAGRTAQDLQRSHHPTWDRATTTAQDIYNTIIYILYF